MAISVSTSVRELEMLLQLSASPALLYSLTVLSSLENWPLAFINVTPEPSGGYKGSPQREGRLLRHFLTSSIHADFPAVSSFPQRDLCFYPETRQTASDLRKAACSCNSVCLTRCTAWLCFANGVVPLYNSTELILTNLWPFYQPSHIF